MNETKFTPGPWKADLDRYPIFIESETEQWPLPDEGEGWASAFVANVGENKANAHLIAAAPDLYKALAHLEPYLDAIVCYASTIEEHPPNGFILETKAALSKARGEG